MRDFRNENPRNLLGYGDFCQNGAGEETRTLDVHLGKVVLYQLSYTREREADKNRLSPLRQ
jgi:hypothetical protein